MTLKKLESIGQQQNKLGLSGKTLKFVFGNYFILQNTNYYFIILGVELTLLRSIHITVVRNIMGFDRGIVFFFLKQFFDFRFPKLSLGCALSIRLLLSNFGEIVLAAV